MNKRDKAIELFSCGNSCSQAILIAFAEDVSIDEQTAFRIGAGLGGGIGRTQNICGAINAGAIILGLKFGNYPADDTDSKNSMGRFVARYINECKQELGATQCLEITKVDLNNQELKQFATETGHLARVCNNAVAISAAILEKYLRLNPDR
jgi:C_GCAxxG_C_C family probable redox protein